MSPPHVCLSQLAWVGRFRLELLQRRVAGEGVAMALVGSVTLAAVPPCWHWGGRGTRRQRVPDRCDAVMLPCSTDGVVEGLKAKSWAVTVPRCGLRRLSLSHIQKQEPLLLL